MKTHLSLALAALTLLLPLAAGAQNAPPLRPAEVAVIGCLMREADYRALRKDDGKGLLGALGQGDEYVLADARPANAPRRAVGTSGQQATDYSLTGKLEDHMVRDIGRMVEVVGLARKGEKEGDLSRLTITVWHPVDDFCPAK